MCERWKVIAVILKAWIIGLLQMQLLAGRTCCLPIGTVPLCHCRPAGWLKQMLKMANTNIYLPVVALYCHSSLCYVGTSGSQLARPYPDHNKHLLGLIRLMWSDTTLEHCDSRNTRQGIGVARLLRGRHLLKRDTRANVFKRLGLVYRKIRKNIGNYYMHAYKRLNCVNHRGA